MLGSTIAHDAHALSTADVWFVRPAAVVFDAADILYDASIWSRWLLQQLHRLGLHTHYQAFVHVLQHDYLAQAYRADRPYGHAFRDFLRSLGLSHGQVDEVLVAAQGARRRFQQSLRPLPGVRRTLRTLAEAGLPMAVLCNSVQTSAQLSATLDQLQLREDFCAVLSSRDLKMALPEAGAYHAAIKALGETAERVAFVGHDPVELAGAAAIGMRTVAFNATSPVAAEVHLNRFDQLLGLVDSAREQMTAA
jgi:FMN phosphatase YigB (HAD superfamily)